MNTMDNGLKHMSSHHGHKETGIKEFKDCKMGLCRPYEYESNIPKQSSYKSKIWHMSHVSTELLWKKDIIALRKFA